MDRVRRMNLIICKVFCFNVVAQTHGDEFVVSQVPESEAPGAPIFCGLILSWMDSHLAHENATRPNDRVPMTEDRFVVSQVPKSEAPGAPIFCGLTLPWMDSHLAHENAARPNDRVPVTEDRFVLSQVPESEAPGAPIFCGLISCGRTTPLVEDGTTVKFHRSSQPERT